MATVQRVHTQARSTGRTSKAAIYGKFAQWATIKADRARLGTTEEALKKDISAYVEANGYQDDKGSFLLDLPEPVEVSGKRYTRIKRQRKISIVFLEDEAREALEKKGLLERCLVVPEPVLDQDMVYVLHQEGLLTEKEIDGFFGRNESFAFVPETE